MATLVAIGYPDQATAEEARHTVQQLEAELIIQADQVAAIPASAVHAPGHSDHSHTLRIRSRYSGALRKYHAQIRSNCRPRTSGRGSS